MTRQIAKFTWIAAAIVLVLGFGLYWMIGPGAPTVFRYAAQKTCAWRVRNHVVFGWSGWRFLEPEVEYATSDLPDSNLDKIAAFAKELQTIGTTLVVVPLPNKVDIYPDKLVWFRSPDPVNPARTAFIRKITDRGVCCIDLEPCFSAARGSFALFDKYDSHWTPLGIELGARTIAEAIDSLPAIIAQAPNARYTVRDTVMTACCDLFDWKDRGGKSAYYPLRCRRVFDSAGRLFSDNTAANILVLGDSFTSHARWWNSNLGAHLARFLNRPTRTYSSLQANTEGPGMYRMKPALFPKNGVVIWAFTSRVLRRQLCAGPVNKTGSPQ